MLKELSMLVALLCSLFVVCGFSVLKFRYFGFSVRVCF